MYLLLFCHSFVSDSLQRYRLQHARLPCPSPTPRAYPNSCPLSRWCHPTISSSVVHFSSCPQSFPASGSFLMSQLFASGGQSTGTSASASVLPVNIQGWFPLRLTGLKSCMWTFNLISFTYNYIFKIYPCSSMYQYFILFRMNRIIGLYRNLFIHSSVDWHLGCFYSLTTMNNAAISIYMQAFLFNCIDLYFQLCWVCI